MKVQEGYHRFMVKIQTNDTFESRHLKRWVDKETEVWQLRVELALEFRSIYKESIINIMYRGEVEYKYDDWEVGI